MWGGGGGNGLTTVRMLLPRRWPIGQMHLAKGPQFASSLCTGTNARANGFGQPNGLDGRIDFASFGAAFVPMDLGCECRNVGPEV
jgi:hypothetical protein